MVYMYYYNLVHRIRGFVQPLFHCDPSQRRSNAVQRLNAIFSRASTQVVPEAPSLTQPFGAIPPWLRWRLSPVSRRR